MTPAPFRFLLTALLLINLALPSHSRSHAVSATPAGIAWVAPATPGAINGSAKVCPGQDLLYSVEAVAGAMYYTWSVPDSWVITSGQGARQISVIAGSKGGVISIVAENNDGVSGARELAVQLEKHLLQPGAIEGPTALCAGSRAKFKVEATAGARSYVWSIPAGWVIVSGQGTSEVEILTATAGGVVRVTAANACGQSAVSQLAVTVYSPLSNNHVQGEQELCVGQQPQTLAGSFPAGGEGAYAYLWESSIQNASEGFIPADGANNQQNYTPGALTETTWFRRRVTSADCQHISDAIMVKVLPVPAKPAIEQLGEKELKASVAGAAYEWWHNGVLLGQQTQVITIGKAGVYSVRVQNSEGCSSAVSDALEVVQQEEEEVQPEEVIPPGVNVTLRPGERQLILSSKEPLPKALLQIADLQGREVYRKEILQLNKPVTLELQQLPDGIYMLLLHTPDLYLKKKVLLQR
ncbi:T9SS type A sorting domain-containing protein [Pontibacter amylolyticus]|nr:T9SS type A sorting domain-containing protein [Pontibacter amylolyticus]